MFRLRYEAPSTKQSLLFALPGIAGQKNNEPNNNSVLNLLTETDERLPSAEQCSICLSELVVPSSDGKNNCNEHDDHAAANILYLLATIATDTSANTPVSLKNCGHKFHLGCLWQGMQHGYAHQCPVCKKALLSLPSADAASTVANNNDTVATDQFIKMLRGNMPSGTMECQLLPSSCAGYENDTETRGSIRIIYRIGSNLQKQYHPNPGVAHSGTTRNAYLPNNTEGRDLLCRLGVAFICGLTFTVGTSLTTNRENSVTWASIHHKTSLTGGSSRHGYPNANFMSNCHEELDALSVPSSDVCSDYLRRNYGTEWVWINNSSSPTVAKVSLPVKNYFYGGGLRHPKGSGQLEGNNIRPKGEEGEALSCLEHSKQSILSLMNTIQTQAFRDFVETNGLLGPVVSSDLFQVQHSSLFESFVKEVQSTLVKGEEFGIGIAFHGTVESNIAAILQKGLDPAKRRGQMYGPGEYFSPRPALPIRYCRGGRKVLIFLLIYEPSNICTNDIVVVNNTHRQLPIGTISFVNTTAQADAAADSFHRHVRWLMEEKNKKESMARAARTKEKIIRLLISGEYLAASDVYNNALSTYGWPSQAWADEVSLYVYDHIRDEEQICIYFPRLPSRPKEAAHVSSLDVAKCEEEAVQAREKYEKMAQINHNNYNPNGMPGQPNNAYSGPNHVTMGGPPPQDQGRKGNNTATVHIAAAKGDLEALKALEKENSDSLFTVDENGWMALHEAVRGGHIKVVQYLLSKGLDINFRTHNGTGGSPLWWAKKCHGKDHAMVKFLEGQRAEEIAPDK